MENYPVKIGSHYKWVGWLCMNIYIYIIYVTYSPSTAHCWNVYIDTTPQVDSYSAWSNVRARRPFSRALYVYIYPRLSLPDYRSFPLSRRQNLSLALAAIIWNRAVEYETLLCIYREELSRPNEPPTPPRAHIVSTVLLLLLYMHCTVRMRKTQ